MDAPAHGSGAGDPLVRLQEGAHGDWLRQMPSEARLEAAPAIGLGSEAAHRDRLHGLAIAHLLDELEATSIWKLQIGDEDVEVRRRDLRSFCERVSEQHVVAAPAEVRGKGIGCVEMILDEQEAEGRPGRNLCTHRADCRSRRTAVGRQLDLELRSAVRCQERGSDRAPMRVDQALGDRETEPQASGAPLTSLLEGKEDALQVLGRYPGTRVGHHDADPALPGVLRAEPDLAAARGMANRVLEHVPEYLAQSRR